MPGDHYFRDPADARDKVADLLAGWVAERYRLNRVTRRMERAPGPRRRRGARALS